LTFNRLRLLFAGNSDLLEITRHPKAIDTANFDGGSCWPLEVALWQVVGRSATGVPSVALFGNRPRAQSARFVSLS
jgi:D-galactarolactone cycloisomerase